MKKFKNIAVKALSLAAAAVTALSVGLNASAAGITLGDVTGGHDTDTVLSYVEKTYDRAVADTMSNDWSFLVVFFKSVDATVEYNGKTVHCKTTIGNDVINDIKTKVVDRLPYQIVQDTHGKVGIDAIDYVYVDEPLTAKDLELGEGDSGRGYRPDAYNSELVRGVLDECLEQNRYSQILIFSPLDEISWPSGWGGSKYDGVHFAHIIMPQADFGYYATIIHEICHGLETDSKALNSRTANLHDMYNYYEISEYDWYERYMNDTLPDGKKGVDPSVFYRLRSEHTPLTGGMTLPAPSNFSIEAKSDTAATFSWDGVGTGYGYQIGLFKDADHKELLFTYNHSKILSETSATLEDLEKGNTYYYGIRSTTTVNGETYYSNWTYLTYTHRGTAQASGGLRIKANYEGYFTFSWDAVPGASGYQLAQLASNYQTYGQDIYDYNADTLSVTLGTYTSYNTYYFGIRSYETVAGEKVWSDWTYLEFEFNASDAVIYGDINNDEQFNLKDVVAALNMCVNEDVLDVRTRIAAGIKGRALLKLADVTALLKAYVNL